MKRKISKISSYSLTEETTTDAKYVGKGNSYLLLMGLKTAVFVLENWKNSQNLLYNPPIPFLDEFLDKFPKDLISYPQTLAQLCSMLVIAR